jgi:hypothetical protein
MRWLAKRRAAADNRAQQIFTREVACLEADEG